MSKKPVVTAPDFESDLDAVVYDALMFGTGFIAVYSDGTTKRISPDRVQIVNDEGDGE